MFSLLTVCYCLISLSEAGTASIDLSVSVDSDWVVVSVFFGAGLTDFGFSGLGEC
jgi:hypothetical protein